MAASIEAPGDNRLFGRPLADDPDAPATGDPAQPASRLWSTTDWSLPTDPPAPEIHPPHPGWAGPRATPPPDADETTAEAPGQRSSEVPLSTDPSPTPTDDRP
jgi:hypothetical protein